MFLHDFWLMLVALSVHQTDLLSAPQLWNENKHSYSLINGKKVVKKMANTCRKKTLKFSLKIGPLILKYFHSRYSSKSSQRRGGTATEEDLKGQDRPQCGAGGWSANTLPGVLHRLCQDDAP